MLSKVSWLEQTDEYLAKLDLVKRKAIYALRNYASREVLLGSRINIAYFKQTNKHWAISLIIDGLLYYQIQINFSILFIYWKRNHAKLYINNTTLK